MPKPQALTMLIELAQENAEAATQRLGRAQREESDALHQLESLVQYRAEYHERFTATARAGVTAGSIQNFQAFITTLDGAIEKQRHLLDAAKRRAAAATLDWQTQKQKVGSYEVLQSRNEAIEARQVARREQRDGDEHAARVFRSRPLDS